jgi:hypothetical protein
MTEHNLPDKDDAPWLDTTYDGFNEDLALKSLGIDRETFGQKPWDEDDLEHKDFIKRYPDVTRVEVIGSEGREYVRYECSNVQVSLQDDGQTIKVFLFSTYD